MKLTFSTLGCPGFRLGQLARLAKDFDIDTLELRGVGEFLDVDSIPELKPENRASTLKFLSGEGISVCMLDCSAFLARENARIEECAYAIHAAAELGIPFIRVFGGDAPDGEKRLAKRINELCTLEPKVTILLETHDSFSDIYPISGVVSRIEHENFGILWDVEHTLHAGIAHDEFLREFSPLVRHVHLKDMNEKGLCLPGDGIIDFCKIRDLLGNCGYDRLLSLEWEKRWVKELPDISFALERFVKILR